MASWNLFVLGETLEILHFPLGADKHRNSLVNGIRDNVQDLMVIGRTMHSLEHSRKAMKP